MARVVLVRKGSAEHVLEDVGRTPGEREGGAGSATGARQGQLARAARQVHRRGRVRRGQGGHVREELQLLDDEVEEDEDQEEEEKGIWLRCFVYRLPSCPQDYFCRWLLFSLHISSINNLVYKWGSNFMGRPLPFDLDPDLTSTVTIPPRI